MRTKDEIVDGAVHGNPAIALIEVLCDIRDLLNLSTMLMPTGNMHFATDEDRVRIGKAMQAVWT